MDPEIKIAEKEWRASVLIDYGRKEVEEMELKVERAVRGWIDVSK